MSALVKLGLKRYMVGGGTGETVRHSKFQTTMHLGSLTVFDKDGNKATENHDFVVKRGQRVLIHPPENALVPSKYEIVVSWNPRLLQFGDVCSPVLIEPVLEDIVMAFTARTHVNLRQDLAHIWELYLID